MVGPVVGSSVPTFLLGCSVSWMLLFMKQLIHGKGELGKILMCENEAPANHDFLFNVISSHRMFSL